MKILIIGESNNHSNLQNVLKTYLPDIEFSLAPDIATVDQNLSQDGYDLVLLEKPLDRFSNPELFQRLRQKHGHLPPVLMAASEDSEDYFRTILDTMPDWLEWFGPDGHYRFISSACERITGYRPEDFFTNPELVLELTHPDDRQRIAEHRQEIPEDKDGCSEFEFRLTHRNGELRWINHHCQPLFHEGNRIGHFTINRDITEQKKAAEEQHLSQQAMLALMNAPSDVIIMVDSQYKIVHVNQTLADRFGKHTDELVGKHILDTLPFSPQLARSRAAIIRRVFETGQPARAEDVGVSGIFDNAYYPVLDEQGTVKLVAIIARDITQHKQVENELRQSYQTIQTLLNAPSDIAVVFDLDGRIQMANETLARVVNHTVSELVGNILWDYFPIEIANARKAVVEKVKRTKKPERVIDRGVFGLYDSILQPILDDYGNITRFTLLARDISDQIKAQEDLSQREAILSTIVNNAPVVMFVFDKTGNITFADGKATSVATHLDEQLIGLNYLKLPITNQIFIDGIEQALNGEDYATQITTYSGYTFETRLTPLRNPSGEITGVICVGVDITENQKIQQELQRSKDELQVILEGVADAVFVSDKDGRVIYANQGAIQMGGFASFDDLIEHHGIPPTYIFSDASGKELSPEEMSANRVAAINQIEPTIMRYRLPNSTEEHWLSIKVTPLYDTKGELQLAVSIFHDITELKHAQASLEASHLELEKKIAERTLELNLANQELVQRVAERQRAATHSEALAHVAARVNIQTDLPSTLQAICEEVTKAVKYTYCSIFLYNEQKDEFRLATSNPTEAISSYQVATPRALYEQYLRLYGPVIVIPDRQALSEAHGAQLLEEYDIRTLISVPLVSNGELIGSLNVASTNEIRLPSPEDLNLLVALADQASIAISKARLFEQVSESRRRLKVLSEKLVEIQESERRNLARELHDEIGQMLTSLRLNLDQAERVMPTDQLSVDEAQKHLNRANETAAQLLGRIREISLDLRPTLLDDLGLLPALLVQFERFTARTNIQVHFKHSGLENRFTAQLETVAFRVIQEALTNVARHAQSGEAYVRLWTDSQFLRLQVEDRGVGFDTQTALASNLTSGLSGMQERVTLCNGQFEIESEPGQGTCLTVELPLK
jgi:PAS domain S-box-containing protein